MQFETVLSLDRWLALGRQLGVPLAVEHFVELQRRYSEPQRFYHTADHVAACLRHFDAAPIATLADGPAVEFALWMHDVVYDPKASNNEQRSADLAREWLLDCDADSELAEQVSRLIMATAHGSKDQSGEDASASWVVDIDLSILGCSAEQFARFGEQIRQEYIHVPKADYLLGRLSVLKSFQIEPELYRTAWAQDRFEMAAKRNLRAEIKRLEESCIDANHI